MVAEVDKQVLVGEPADDGGEACPVTSCGGTRAVERGEVDLIRGERVNGADDEGHGLDGTGQLPER